MLQRAISRNKFLGVKFLGIRRTPHKILGARVVLIKLTAGGKDYELLNGSKE